MTDNIKENESETKKENIGGERGRQRAGSRCGKKRQIQAQRDKHQGRQSSKHLDLGSKREIIHFPQAKLPHKVQQNDLRVFKLFVGLNISLSRLVS